MWYLEHVQEERQVPKCQCKGMEVEINRWRLGKGHSKSADAGRLVWRCQKVQQQFALHGERCDRHTSSKSGEQLCWPHIESELHCSNRSSTSVNESELALGWANCIRLLKPMGSSGVIGKATCRPPFIEKAVTATRVAKAGSSPAGLRCKADCTAKTIRVQGMTLRQAATSARPWQANASSQKSCATACEDS